MNEITYQNTKVGDKVRFVTACVDGNRDWVHVLFRMGEVAAVTEISGEKAMVGGFYFSWASLNALVEKVEGDGVLVWNETGVTEMRGHLKGHPDTTLFIIQSVFLEECVMFSAVFPDQDEPRRYASVVEAKQDAERGLLAWLKIANDVVNDSKEWRVDVAHWNDNRAPGVNAVDPDPGGKIAKMASALDRALEREGVQ